MSEQIILRSSLLLGAGFAHGFSLRTGGVSEGPFASLNLGRSVGDDPDRVAENVRRFCDAIGASAERLYETSQVHGRHVAIVRAPADIASVRAIEADALATREAVAVGVRTADCVPILLADPRSGAVAAVHAGWRGVAARVIEAAVEALRDLGVDPRDLVAAIGPHIRPDAFEVGGDVAMKIADASYGAQVVIAREPRPHVDLAKALRAQLAHLGVDRVDDVGGCTLTEPARFFSHRRDAGRTGRHLAAIAPRALAPR